MFVLKLRNQACWIAPWKGDPGRTLVIRNAKKYNTRESAEKARLRLMKRWVERRLDLEVERVV